MFQSFEVLARLNEHNDASMTLLHGPLHFGHGDLNATHIGNNGQWHIAVTHLTPGRDGIIVGPDTGQLKCRVALKEGATLHRIVGKEDLAIHPILIQGSQPVCRVVDVTGDLVPVLWEIFTHWISHHGRAIDHTTVPHHLSVHHPALHRTVKGYRHVRLVRGLCKVRDGIAPFGFRHPAGKGILVRLRM